MGHRGRYVPVLVSVIVLCLGAHGTAAQASPAPSADYEDLLALFEEFREFVQPPRIVNGVPDYSAPAIAAQARALDEFKSRLEAIDPRSWPVAQQVDYMVVRAELNGLDFDLHVKRPWERDPGFYETTVTFGFMPRMHGSLRLTQGGGCCRVGTIVMPVPADRIEATRAGLEAVPRILEQAKSNLTDVGGDLARLAIRQKGREAAIYRDFASQAAGHHPDLVPLAERAAEATDEFRGWLEQNESRWTAPSGLGKENYDWLLKYVHIYPYTWDEIVAVGRREWGRTVSFLKMEEHSNREVPALDPVTSQAAFDRAYRAGQRQLLDFIDEHDVITMPDYLEPGEPDTFDPTPSEQLSFFTAANYRDPRPLQAHGLIGHDLDAAMRRRDDRPIRGTNRLYFVDGIRADGWATYLEEMLMHVGAYEDSPRTREILYIMQAKRAARIASELRMHSNDWTFREAFVELVRHSPYWMGDNDPIAWYDLELYLRQPGYGQGYTMGKVQLEELIAERHLDLGEDFDLGEFHDEFLASGSIPISLIRWEMTGRDDQVEHMFEPHSAPRRQETGRVIGEVDVIGDVIHLELEPGVVEPANLFDLDGRTLRFTPAGTGYRVENAPLRWDDELGADVTQDAVRLRNFTFPFSGGRHDRFDVATGALTFAHPRTGEPTDFDLERYVRLRTVGPELVDSVSGIAAFLKPRLSGDTFVKETGDRVVVTWVLSESPGGIQSFTWEPTVNRIQAVLHESGVIELSYDGVSARDAIVGVFPMGGAMGRTGPAPSAVDLSAARAGDGPVAVPFEGFHWSERPRAQDVACTLITELGDRFDFIATYSDFRVDDPEGGTPSTGPRGGNVTGIGREMREPADYCSQGQLQSMFASPVSTAAVQQHERSPDGSMTDWDYAMSQISHELGHRWAASADAIVDGERIELGRTHWYAGLHYPAAFPYGRSYESDIMGGSTWQENPDGTFTQLDRDFYNPAKGVAWLSLYFMGLASPDEVPPFFFLRNLERTGRTDAEGRPIYTGDKVVVTVEDVIAAMGPRLPRYEVSQKDFNTAIVVITEPGKEPTDILLHNARNIAETWVEYWETTTGGRSTMTVDPG